MLSDVHTEPLKFVRDGKHSLNENADSCFLQLLLLKKKFTFYNADKLFGILTQVYNYSFFNNF